MIGRRSFFRTLLAPLVTLAIPKQSLTDAINDGINPAWDGVFKPKYYSVEIPALDEINVTALRVLKENPVFLDSIFKQSPLFDLLTKRQRVIDAGGKIVGQFCRMPGEPWERLSGGLRYPIAGPRLPS